MLASSHPGFDGLVKFVAAKGLAQITLANQFILNDVARNPFGDDPAVIDDIGLVGNLQCSTL